MDKKTVVLGAFRREHYKRAPLTVRVDIEISSEHTGDASKPRLSISGDTYYPGARDIESGGQIQDEVRRLLDTPGTALNRPRHQIERLLEIWERWHLNDCRAGCEHQRAAWKPEERIHLTTFKLKSSILVAQRALERAAVERLEQGETVMYTAEQLALARLPWKVVAGVDQPAPGPQYEAEKTEIKTAGWVKPEEHPRGLLCKPCPTCGYKYGSAWLYEPIPAEVVKFLEDF